MAQCTEAVPQRYQSNQFSMIQKEPHAQNFRRLLHLTSVADHCAYLRSMCPDHPSSRPHRLRAGFPLCPLTCPWIFRSNSCSHLLRLSLGSLEQIGVLHSCNSRSCNLRSRRTELHLTQFTELQLSTLAFAFSFVLKTTQLLCPNLLQIGHRTMSLPWFTVFPLLLNASTSMDGVRVPLSFCICAYCSVVKTPTLL